MPLPRLICLTLIVLCVAMLGATASVAADTAVLDLRTTQVISLDGAWSLAIDPKNVGRNEKWWERALPEAKSATVPGIIQDVWHNYHGVAWYSREFTPPQNPHVGGRYLLRFWQADYLADVWVNDVYVGQHEGGEDPFVFDITDIAKPDTPNRVVVRVLNPTHEPIDGFKLSEIPRRNKSIPHTPGCDYNYGGLTDAVELLIAPAVRVEDLFVRPDPKKGRVRVQINVRNAGKQAVAGHLRFSIGPAVSGETLQVAQLDRRLPPGDTVVECELAIAQPRLWQLNDPYLYRVWARATTDGSLSYDEQSARCGFRDFRFENGAFRLNGKRLFLKCSHSGCELPCPRVAFDPDLLRKDILNCKVMGFNSIRFISGVPPRYQLALCDEVGLMVYEECYAGWCLADSPQMAQRFDHATAAMIKRDRNHPSITMWGVLNETVEGPVFRHAVDSLALVRKLDDTRLVFLNSGRFDLFTPSMSGLAFWENKAFGPDPNVTFNTNTKPLAVAWGTWAPKQMALHPGPNGEYSAMRWTAPAAGKYDIAATFSGIGTVSTTDVHVFVAGKEVANASILGPGKTASFNSGMLSLPAGAAVYFAVGFGTGGYGGDTTGVTAKITAENGQVFEPTKDFSVAKNPNGDWAFGLLKPGPSPDPDTFSLYKNGRINPVVGHVGSLSNPGSPVWEDVMADMHPYQQLPHDAGVIHTLRTVGADGNPLFLSEYGMGSAVDLVRMARHFEEWGKTDSDDAVYYRDRLDKFMADWNRWNLGDTFANPEDYFRQCLAWMAPLRKLGINAIRANPNCIGYSLTGTQDQGVSGEGLTTLFRDLKPGTLDDMFDAWYPLRWCLFVEPVQVYRGRKAHIEAVLSNEDMLRPGSYPVRFQVVGPRNVSVFDRTINVDIPDPKGKPEPKFAMPVLSEDVVIDGPAGKYRFFATFQKGAAAAGGDIEFYVADAAEMPKVETEVVLWGNDPDLAKWLNANGIKSRPFVAESQPAREVILVGAQPAAGEAAAFRALAEHIARGSYAIFLCPEVFKKDNNSAAWLPLANKGTICGLPLWLYHKDDWLKNHPVFSGLPCGGIMDHTFYREILPKMGFSGQDVPSEIISGAIDTSCNYGSVLTAAVYELGAGRFMLNSLRIREHLGSDPVAEHLLRNMLRHAARDAGKPAADLPANFAETLKSFGY